MLRFDRPHYPDAGQPAPEGRELAISRPILTPRSERWIAARVVVAPKNRSRLLVEATAHQDTEGVSQRFFELRFGGAAAKRPGVGIAPQRETQRAFQVAEVNCQTRRHGLTRALVRLVLLSLDCLTKNDASVRIALKTVDELGGVGQLSLDDRSPRLRPAPLERVDVDRVRRSGRIRAETARGRLE